LAVSGFACTPIDMIARKSVLLLLSLLCQAPPAVMSFHFADPRQLVHSFDSALPRKLLPELQREALAAKDWEQRTRPTHLRDSKGSTSWMPIEQFENPRSWIELAITYLHKMAFPEDSPWTGGGPYGDKPTQLAGAEWWIQNKDTKEDIGFHYDKDEGVASEEYWMKMPTMSSVFCKSFSTVRVGPVLSVSDPACVPTDLTDVGAPTMVLNKTTNEGGNEHTPIVPTNGYFSYPRKNRYPPH
jgi:hypothetical protein